MKTLVFKRDIRYKVFLVRGLGKDGATKSDDFLEKIQTAFNPLLIFGNLHCKFFGKRPIVVIDKAFSANWNYRKRHLKGTLIG